MSFRFESFTFEMETQLLYGGSRTPSTGHFRCPFLIPLANQALRRAVFPSLVALASETPHGGVKQSGYGKDGSKYALEDYTFVKHVMINTGI